MIPNLLHPSAICMKKSIEIRRPKSASTGATFFSHIPHMSCRYNFIVFYVSFVMLIYYKYIERIKTSLTHVSLMQCAWLLHIVTALHIMST